MAELTIKKDLLQGIGNEIFSADGMLTAQGRNLIERVELTLAAVKDAEKEIREKVLAEMKEKKIVKITSGDVSLTYKDAYDREGIDTARLKEEQPDIYDEYSKTTPVKESLVIKVGKNG